MSYQELSAQALNVSLKERAALAHELLRTLERPSKEEVATLWLEEAERRLELIEQGEKPIIVGEEARRRGHHRHG